MIKRKRSLVDVGLSCTFSEAISFGAPVAMKTPRERHKLVVDYLKMKVEEGDWHGVADAAMDLRELEAAYPKIFIEQDRKGWPRA